MERLKLICSGLVQAVGFRYFVYELARSLRVTGYVLNLDDGDVLIEVQGKMDQLQTFIRLIKAGNGYSRIDRLIQYPLTIVPKESSFEIRYAFI